MSGQQIVFLVILVGTLSLFVTERLRIDMAALLALLALTITGIRRQRRYRVSRVSPQSSSPPFSSSLPP